jgi:hypothetical protein
MRRVSNKKKANEPLSFKTFCQLLYTKPFEFASLCAFNKLELTSEAWKKERLQYEKYLEGYKREDKLNDKPDWDRINYLCECVEKIIKEWEING